MSDLKNHIKKIQSEQALENFVKWFKDGGIVDDNQQPLTLYCGTLSNYNTFDIYHTNPESHFGQGFYLTTNPDDASFNYATTDGSDQVKKIKDLVSDFEHDLLTVLSDYYQYEIDNPDSSEINAKISTLYFCEENGEDYDDELFNEVLEYHKSRVLDWTHEGMVMPVFAVSKKLMDVENHVFETQQALIGIEDLLSHVSNEYHEIHTEIYDYFQELMKEIDQVQNVYYDDFKPVLDMAIENADAYEDDLIEEIQEYFKDYFEANDNVVSYQLKLEGDLFNLRDHMVNILRDQGYEHEADLFFDAYNEEFTMENSYTARDIIDTCHNDLVLVDSPIEANNIYQNSHKGLKALFSLAVQQMGYDGIVMNPEVSFPHMDHIEDTKHYVLFEANNIKSSIGNNGEYSLMDNNILHRVCHKLSLEREKDNYFTKNEADHILKDIKLHYKNMPKCKVYTDMDMIEPRLKISNPDITTCSGVFEISTDTAYIFLPNIVNKKDFIKTVCHEVFGHMSLRDILFNNYESTMNKVYDYYEKKNELADIKKDYVGRYNLDLSKSKDRAIIGEEKMAAVIEEHGFDSFPLKKVIIGAIRSGLRKVIPSLNFTESDITYLAYNCHKNIKDAPTTKTIKQKKNRMKHH